MKVYIAGPMTGYPDYNFPAFNWAEDYFRRIGYAVANPAKINGVPPAGMVVKVGDAVYQEYLRKDFAELVTCTHIYLLPGWEDSNGAMLEWTIARAIGLRRLHG